MGNNLRGESTWPVQFLIVNLSIPNKARQTATPQNAAIRRWLVDSERRDKSIMPYRRTLSMFAVLPLSFYGALCMC